MTYIIMISHQIRTLFMLHCPSAQNNPGTNEQNIVVVLHLFTKLIFTRVRHTVVTSLKMQTVLIIILVILFCLRGFNHKLM